MRRFANVSRIERCYNGGQQSTEIHNHGMVEMIMIAKWDVILDYSIKYTIYFVKITHCVLASIITYPAPLIVPAVISLSIMHQWQYAVCMMTSSNGNISALLAFTGEFPAQRPVTRSFDVFFDLRLNKPLSKQSWGWSFETPSRSSWGLCNDQLSEGTRQEM